MAAKTLTAPSNNPFWGTATTPAPAFIAPEIAPPPAMSNRPESVSTITTVDSVIANSARSVQATNAKYNEQAYESYNKAVSEWQQNNGRRWIGGNVFAQTTEPPPPPKYLPTNFNEIYADIAANYQTGRPHEMYTANRPYYMGGSVFSEPKTS
jgi:hypothetical protein